MTKQNQTITVNRLPAKTWNWLKMNETVIGMPRIPVQLRSRQTKAGSTLHMVSATPQQDSVMLSMHLQQI